MEIIVLCGNRHTSPDLAVGPFPPGEEAGQWIAGQPVPPDRYAVAMPLIAPANARVASPS